MLFIGTTLLVSIMALAEGGAPTWWDYPGLEAWKFLNLFIFVVAMVYFLKRPLTDAFKARREAIRRDLLKARAEKEESLAKLAGVQVQLDRLDSEVANIHHQSISEAQAERVRIAQDTESEMQKLREQAQREVAGAGKVAIHDLRLYAARQSVKLAEQIIRREIRSDDDARLIDMNVEQLGRA
jgi:F0F1-type ATP synthase membrane subunit b/b'